jgi:hypothetical protein
MAIPNKNTDGPGWPNRREKKLARDIGAGLFAADVHRNKSRKKEPDQPYYDWQKLRKPPEPSQDFEAMRLRLSDSAASPEDGRAAAQSMQKTEAEDSEMDMPFYGQEPGATQKNKSPQQEQPSSEEDQEEDSEEDPDYVEPEPVLPPQTADADVGWVTAFNGSLKDKFQQMGKEAMNDPAIKRQLHTLGWDVIETFITPAVLITFPAANYFAIVGRLWKKDDFRNPLYHIFSTGAFWLIILLDILLFVCIIAILALFVVTYCYASGKALIAILPGDSGICEEVGIINMLQAFGIL